MTMSNSDDSQPTNASAAGMMLIMSLLLVNCGTGRPDAATGQRAIVLKRGVACDLQRQLKWLSHLGLDIASPAAPHGVPPIS